MVSSRTGRALRRFRAGDKHSITRHEALRALASLRITSAAFDEGAEIPLIHAGEGLGDNISPGLAWDEPPVGTRQLALIIEDIDVPLPRPLVHTIALLPPDLRQLPEGALEQGFAGIRFVPAGFGRTGYAGPRPIPGHGPHRYGFHLYALDANLSEVPLRGAKDFLNAASGHAIAAGHLTGIHQRS